MDIKKLHERLKDTELEPWSLQLDSQIEKGLSEDANGKLPEWKQVVDSLPGLQADIIILNESSVTVGAEKKLTENESDLLKEQLKQLMPWRKGPYTIHGVHIDTEWRSDHKWQRLLPYIGSLEGKKILDVGCGNGYHGWRMRGLGAELVIGIDPSPLFIMQFLAINHFIKDENIYVLPLGIEDVPDNLQGFDTVFSMGVFYHRKSPIDHLYQLRQCLKPGGQLVLETLVIEGDERQVLLPEDRYAQMRNVWFIPSSKAMILWMERCGLKNVRLADETYTSFEEQRQTEWMQFHSLKEFLDPDDFSKTIEGYPAPLRAVFIADAP